MNNPHYGEGSVARPKGTRILTSADSLNPAVRDDPAEWARSVEARRMPFGIEIDAGLSAVMVAEALAERLSDEMSGYLSDRRADSATKAYVVCRMIPAAEGRSASVSKEGAAAFVKELRRALGDSTPDLLRIYDLFAVVADKVERTLQEKPQP